MESKRRFGDRKDGRLIQSLAPFYKFMPYIMPTKNDACNQFEDCIEITNTDRWLRQKRLEGYKGLGYLHLFIAAYIRMVSMRPGINRFVAGRRIYARNNIEVVLTVRRSMSTTSNETTIKAVFAPTDTIFDVYRKMNEKIDEIKYGDQDNNTEQVAGALLKLPRFLLRFAIGCLRVMDYFGIIPQKLLDASPFHGSMIITDMGSLGIPPIYHHLYNFGRARVRRVLLRLLVQVHEDVHAQPGAAGSPARESGRGSVLSIHTCIRKNLLRCRRFLHLYGHPRLRRRPNRTRGRTQQQHDEHDKDHKAEFLHRSPLLCFRLTPVYTAAAKKAVAS